MDAKTLEDMINDSSVPDDVVFNATQEFLTDKFDGEGNGIPPSENEMADTERLGTLMRTKRPSVQKRLHNILLDEHDQCCRPNTPCKDS